MFSSKDKMKEMTGHKIMSKMFDYETWSNFETGVQIKYMLVIMNRTYCQSVKHSPPQNIDSTALTQYPKF